MTSKADRFIALLDAARCKGDWQDVPEIVRKLTKHAPHRKCLIESARAESSLALSIKNGGRNAAVDAQRFIPALRAAVQSEKTYVEDILQAQVCLIWLYWTLHDLSGVQSHSPWHLIQNQLGDEKKKHSGWTEVSIIKGIYIIGNTYERSTLQPEALRTYASGLTLISRTLDSSVGIEFAAWTERLLAAYCLLSSQLVVSNLDGPAITTVLMGFRLWAQLWANHADHDFTAVGGNIVGTTKPRRQIWELYHSLLSTILQYDLLYPPFIADNGRDSALPDSAREEQDADANSNLRVQQRAELQRVQETYECLLLAEVSFPRANEFNKEIERWVELVMGNWRIFCCGNRLDKRELDEGGKDSFAKSVLDVRLQILYRAAAKSFHSTLILRSLFTVHAFLDELDLAIKALETYIELIKKGRYRASKSGGAEANLDSDEIVLQTACQGVKYLCCHASDRVALTVKEVGIQIEKWLEESEQRAKALAEAKTNGAVTADEQVRISSQTVSNHTLASGYRAVGISRAYWSRTTYDAEFREDMRKQSLLNLQRSVSADYKDTENPDSLFTLGLLLAESGELDKAVVAVKHALLRQAHALRETWSEVHSPTLREPPFPSTAKYLSLWHLLVLILSAAQDFDTALNTCEAVVAQLDGTLQWKGENDANGSTKAAESNNSSLLQTGQDPSPNQSRALQYKLENWEKEASLQIKMTHLALIEVTEGSEAAINTSDELLRLYSTLYGGQTELKFRSGPLFPVPAKPPRNSSGTLRNIRQSLFGRLKGTRGSLQHITSTFALANVHTPPAKYAGEPHEGHDPQGGPQIQVVNEYNQVTDSSGYDSPHNHTVQSVGRSHSRRLHKRNRSLDTTMGSTSFHSKRNVGSSTSDVTDDASHLSVNSSVLSGASGRMASHGSNALQIDNAHQFHNSQPCSSDNQASQASQVGMELSHDMQSSKLDASVTDGRQLHGVSIRGDRSVSCDHSDREKSPGSGSEELHRHDRHLLPDDHALGAGSRPPRRRIDHRRYSLLVKVWLFIAGLYRRATLYGDAKGAIIESLTALESLETEITIEASTFGALAINDQSLSRSIDELRADVLTEHGYLAQAQAHDQDALEYFEQAVSCCIDHPLATVGLCNILLDYSSGTATRRPSRTPLPPDDPAASSMSVSNHMASISTSDLSDRHSSSLDPSSAPGSKTRHPSASKESFLELDRLAARDRAYGLLLSLTKLAGGWDLSSAWFELSRVYEQSGQMEKAREVLWRCIELEDKKPIRHWRNAETRGYVL